MSDERITDAEMGEWERKATLILDHALGGELRLSLGENPAVYVSFIGAMAGRMQRVIREARRLRAGIDWAIAQLDAGVLDESGKEE